MSSSGTSATTAAHFSVTYLPDPPPKLEHETTRLLLDSQDFQLQSTPLNPSLGVTGNVVLHVDANACLGNLGEVPALVDLSNTYSLSLTGTGASPNVVSTSTGLKCISCPGTGKYYITGPTGPTTGSLTIVAAHRFAQANASSLNALLSTSGSWATGHVNLGLNPYTNYAAEIYGENGPGFTSVSYFKSNLGPVSEFTVIGYTDDNATGTFYLNGTAFESSAITSTMTKNLVSMDVLSGLGRLFDGKMYELIVWDRALSAAEMANVNTYLQTKWYEPPLVASGVASSDLVVDIDQTTVSGPGSWLDSLGRANLATTGAWNSPHVYSALDSYFSYDGTSQYGTLPSIANVTEFTGAQSYSVAFWFWPASVQNYTAAADNSVVEKWSAVAGYPYAFRYLRATQVLEALAYDGTSLFMASTAAQAVSTNAWHHVAGVFDWAGTRQISLYLDGALSGTSAPGFPGTLTNGSPVFVGMRGNSQNYFTGYVGSLKIFDRALSAFEVRQLSADNTYLQQKLYDPPAKSMFSGSIELGASHGIFRNVVSCELKALSFPKVGGERYVVLSIPALNDKALSSTDAGTDRAFAVCYFDSDLLLPGQIKPMKGKDFYQKVVRYSPAINKLDRLDVSFQKWGGNVVTMDDVGGAANVKFSVVLELVAIGNRSW